MLAAQREAQLLGQEGEGGIEQGVGIVTALGLRGAQRR